MHHVYRLASSLFVLCLSTPAWTFGEYVRGTINEWGTSAPMTQDAAFGSVWKATVTASSNNPSGLYKFDRFGNWVENWGLGSSAAKNSAIGNLNDLGGDLSFSQNNGMRYSFQMLADHSAHVLMETDYDPVSISGATDDHTAAGPGPVTVSITLSTVRSFQENVYVRYSTSLTFSASALAMASGFGTTAEATIPGQLAGTKVFYYVITSTMPTNLILAQPDLCTLRGLNAGTSNFYYEVVPGPSTGFVPVAEFTETNAADWGSFSTVDFAPTSVSNDFTRVKAGTASIRFDTRSGFPTGVRYPASASLHWDVASFTHLQFWAYAINTNVFGFQDTQPIVRLHSPGGTFTYTPNSTLMYNNTWHLYRIPLAGDATWMRSVSGSPTLIDVTQLEIQNDTWDSGFTIFYDSMKFVTLTPGGLPPAGPPPPPGVNPDAIEPKVLLYIYDPLVEMFGTQRTHVAYGWTDPVWLAHQMASDLRSNSHDLVRYHIVATNIVDEYPYFTDGYRFDDASFYTTWTSRVEHPAMFDYARFVNSNGINPRIASGEIDEVWVYSMPFVGTWESTMAGAGAYWCNSTPVQGVTNDRLFVIMGLNYERGVAEAIHSYGHRAESIMVHSYGTWLANTNNHWNMFTLYDKQIPGQGHVGNIHFPVNATADYEYASTTLVPSYHQRWTNYPNLGTSPPQMVNVLTWSPTLADPQRDYLNWWYRHLPHVSGRGPDYFLNNWWRYIADPDQFKNSDGNLYYTEGVPSARILTLSNGVEVCGYVPVTVEATADGALGRVDLYMDGQYMATDTMAPYTFSLDVTALAGDYTLTAKAVELQNGTESTSTTINVSVQPMALQNVVSTTGGMGVTWSSCPNWTSRVEQTTHLDGPWSPVTSAWYVATGGSYSHTGVVPIATTSSGSYYRIAWPTP